MSKSKKMSLTKLFSNAATNNLGFVNDAVNFDAGNVIERVIGSIPDKVKAITHPDAVALKDDIRSIIFQSLRETLGAQFTQKEGERLVDASFNDMLDESINLERMQRLFDTTLKAANAKKEQIAYFKKNGTLKKWEGETFTYESIASDLYKKDDYKNFSKDQLEEMFVSPNVDEAEAKIIEQILKDME